MKTFRCTCGNRLYFENTQCLRCSKVLGYLQDMRLLSPIEALDSESWGAAYTGPAQSSYRKCRNYMDHAVCNWMIPLVDDAAFCTSCRLNRIIPNLSEPKNITLWNRIEAAKRRLIYTLQELDLPIIDRTLDPGYGLEFEFLSDAGARTEFYDTLEHRTGVLTGHRSGTITINIAEADPSAREQMREKMNEQYRTLLGHFRHEIGHYYWNHLVAGSSWLDQARALFGDEQSDYEQALESYYTAGPRQDWSSRYISAYASSHPWEDWAETWAHYLHMIDTLETAHDFGFVISGRSITHPSEAMSKGVQYTFDPRITFEALLEDWIDLTIAMNELNRSMGLPDAYPFVLSKSASEKLRLVHRLVQNL